ncbi:Rrf2 family transcriptional regulator [uncultured Ruminococcus sp.]|uniref:RrF2 family transcriptional regulator n=1 Tax=uncultured Ruminococcus sp. TaxID=165186 RepID=UPI000EBB2829|nr:Rrf2 family transcriptional regulator [uncultured Ruminococcus sp.]HCJ40629.1 Rrf2 family transcriptional regulator [Ruminococcus sp.]
MKVSTKVESGIVALADIAIYSAGGETVSSADISKRQNISQKYLEQILVALRQAGFIRGQKGSRGGYVLARPAKEISFSEILDGLDNTILADTHTAEQETDGGLRDTVNSCIWEKLNSYMRDFTAKMTLADFIELHSSDSTDDGGGLMYYI